VGVDQELFDGKMSMFLTYFHAKIDNMIEYDSSISKYNNIAKVKTKGYETGLSYRPAKYLSFDLHYTYTEAKNETEGDSDQGKYLKYRPRHTGGADINIKPVDRLNLNLNAQYVGKRYRDDGNAAEMPEYTLFNFAASYDVNKYLQLFGRIENLTDKKYQSVYKFGEPGIGFYGGIKLTF
jgi:vitamin B12 transporter